MSTKLPHTRLPQFDRDISGALSHGQAERFAMSLAEGKEPNQAWVAAGGKNASASLTSRQLWFANPIFQERVEQLRAERHSLYADERWGYARWMVRQAFRAAQSENDASGMAQAAKLSIELEKAANPRPPGRPPAEVDAEATEDAEGAVPAKVGRPTINNPQSRRNVADIRSKLLNMGLKAIAPKPGEAA